MGGHELEPSGPVQACNGLAVPLPFRGVPCFLLSVYQHKLIHVPCSWRLELPLQCQYTSTRLCGITSQAVNFIISNVLQV